MKTVDEMVAMPLLELNTYAATEPSPEKERAEAVLEYRTDVLTPFLQDKVSKNKAGGLGPGSNPIGTPPPPPAV